MFKLKTTNNHVRICNAFSLQMLDLDNMSNLIVTPVTVEEVTQMHLESAVGHTDTAAVLSTLLGQDISAQRINVKLQPGETIIVAQLVGGRLPEGSTTLPQGFSFKFVKVTLI